MWCVHYFCNTIAILEIFPKAVIQLYTTEMIVQDIHLHFVNQNNGNGLNGYQYWIGYIMTVIQVMEYSAPCLKIDAYLFFTLTWKDSHNIILSGRARDNILCKTICV